MIQVEGDCSIKINPDTNEVILGSGIMEMAYEQGRDAFIEKRTAECVAYIKSLHGTEEEKRDKFSEFVLNAVKKGTKLILLPVEEKEPGFDEMFVSFKDKNEKDDRQVILALINKHFTYEKKFYERLKHTMYENENYVSTILTHIKEDDKPEILLGFVFTF